jgi:hypothetical protein
VSDPNSRRKLFIQYSKGNHLLESVQTWDPDDDSDVEVLTNATKDGGAGFRDKPGGGSINMEVFRWSPDLEVDWQAIKDRKERFTLTSEDDDDGVREQYQVCRVANIKGKASNQGENMDTVKVVFLHGPIRLPRRGA